MGTDFTIAAVVPLPFHETLERTRAALADNGFGIITEIDLAGTLKKKLDVTTSPQVILGACRPELAYRAIQASPAIAAVLPCNVVVRGQGPGVTVVEAFDPAALARVADDAALDVVADDARARLLATLDQLTGTRARR